MARGLAGLLASLTLAAAGCGSDGGPGAAMALDGAADTSGGDGDASGPTDRGDGAVPPAAGVMAAGVRWFGRVDVGDPTHPRFSWSGTGFVARFSGTSLTMQLQAGNTLIFKTVIDGAPQPPFTIPSGQGSYPLATGLAAGVHTVELYRQTEGPQGDSQLMALTVGEGALIDPPPGPGRLIEVIGDSISCGYGELGSLSDTDCFSTESHWDTYGAIAARALGAEVSTIAASGRGIIRNYGGDTAGTLPLVYALTLANDAAPIWDFHIQPNAVVINLGTNDISNNKGDPGTAFRDTYLALLGTVRSHYPDAWIVCLIAPLLGSADAATIEAYIQSAVDMRKAAGDTRLEAFNQIAPQTSDKFACAYHPNLAENTLMADALAAELRAKLGW
jgi:lysophospholipase L1-like esterase